MDKWIAVDWGTSFFRAYLIKDEKVLCAAKTNDGMKFVQNNNFEETLVNSIEPWLNNKYKIEVLASGMIGSKQGWIEAPYQKIPCNLNNIEFISRLRDDRFSVKFFRNFTE